MSEIAKKYGMTDEAYKMAVNDGVISCSWRGREEIFIYYKEKLKTADNKTEAVKQTADHFGCERSYVFQILRYPVFK